MSSVSWVPQIRPEWRSGAMDVRPVNTPEPWVSLDSEYEGQWNTSSIHDPRINTLICSAPSTLGPVVKAADPYPLILACVTIEFGRDTDEDDWDPRRSSGSQRSCCMRFTPSCDTWGVAGKRSDLRQFRIICRVTCRCKARTYIDSPGRWKQKYIPNC